MINKLSDIFQQKFSSEPLIVRSPGRVNIIGEHTDYNEGFVLPASIDKAIYVAVSKRDDGQVHLFSCDYNEGFEVALSAIQPTENWTTYILGVVDQLVKRKYSVAGFNLAMYGDVPIGAGLSSSAAVECATVFALNELFSFGIEKMEMVRIAQKAEHTYAGVMCGIMDQFASVFGKKNHVIKLDCRSLEFEYKPLKLKGYKLVLFNSNVKHSLSATGYNTRRQQCEQGIAWIKKVHPGVNSLRDVTMEMLHTLVAPKDKIIYKRCKYVVEEVQRLLSACDDLEKGNILGLGRKMFETHDGLSTEYEVSCEELDYLVNSVKGNTSVVGARMMGGGFGGCTINLIEENAIGEMIDRISASYKTDMQLTLSAYIVKIEQGTERITNNTHVGI